MEKQLFKVGDSVLVNWGQGYWGKITEVIPEEETNSFKYRNKRYGDAYLVQVTHTAKLKEATDCAKSMYSRQLHSWILKKAAFIAI